MNIDLESLQEQFSNLDPDNIGNWPILVRSLIVLLCCALVLGGTYYFVTQDQLAELERREAEETQLMATFKEKQKKAASLEDYKAQMQEMEESFGTMLRQLPSKTEVADLLVDITQTGLASGLEFDLFQPKSEIPQDFYAEKPIDIIVKGEYHELGQFVSGIAALPRIVTIHNIEIERGKGSKASPGELKMKAVAKTYRYLDEEEIAAGKKKKARSKR